MEGRRKITNIRFNQNFELFSCILEGAGIQIYNVEPLALKAHIPFEKVGHVSLCELFDRRRWVVFVGKEKDSLYPNDKVMIWCDHHKRLEQSISMKTRIFSLRIREGLLVVVTMKRITLFTFPNANKLAHLNTCENAYGLCEITPQINSATNFIFYPDHKPGILRWESLASLTSSSAKSSSTMLRSRQVHESAISNIAVNMTGTMVATSSIKGTVFRVFDTIKKELIVEFRRGMDHAKIFSLAFQPSSNFLAVTSDKKTVHIFSLADKDSSSIASAVIPNYDFAKFTVDSDFFSVCGFGGNSIYAIDANANFYKYLLTKDGCTQKYFTDFTNYMEEELF